MIIIFARANLALYDASRPNGRTAAAGSRQTTLAE
jgi:hypothetical protein